MFLSIKNLNVAIEDKAILSSLNLDINEGELHCIMGPNGSGKSTLANTLMGHPKFEIKSGQILLSNKEINSFSADKRAKEGIFLAFQYPIEIDGISLYDLLRTAYNALYVGTDKQLGVKAFRTMLYEKLDLLNIKHEFVERFVNLGFSGGEKKKAEILQFAVLQPKLIILDEIDSGLDIDALKTVCNGINVIRAHNLKISFIIITHYQRILNYIKPDYVHVLKNGQIVESGGCDLANKLDLQGYNE